MAVAAGKLTTHVLDTANGRPAKGMRVQLFNVDDKNERRLIKEAETNHDGRLDAPLLVGDELLTGVYELVFFAGDYFKLAHVPLADPPFLDDVVLRVGLHAGQHYHVPLLVSPWSYSTYRGS